MVQFRAANGGRPAKIQVHARGEQAELDLVQVRPDAPVSFSLNSEERT
jgi:hypothetical protein